MPFYSISHTYIHKRARAREQNNKIYTCSLREKQVFCRFFCIYEKKVVILQRGRKRLFFTHKTFETFKTLYR